MPPSLPLRSGAHGEPVLDVQRRLAAAGFDAREAGRYGDATAEAVRRFQKSRGLTVDGECGPQTWNALVEAGFRLGDRLIYLRAPMLRGEDIAELQGRLGALGFDAGRVDGIFGPDGAAALEDFQRNTGLTVDGICGPDTVAALARLGERGGPAGNSPTTVRRVRDVEALRTAPRRLAGRRVAIGELGGLGALVDATGRRLRTRGAQVTTLHQPDESAHARAANGLAADAYMGLALRPEPGAVLAYYADPRYESVGGLRLATELGTAVAPHLSSPPDRPVGMRRPILRETRMPAVWAAIGPPGVIVARTGELAAAIAGALEAWVLDPISLTGDVDPQV